MPRSLTHLTSSISRAAAAMQQGVDMDQVAALDHAAARLVEAAHACGALPEVIVPAQRTLLLLGGRPRRGATPTDPDGLMAALDAVLDPAAQAGGFSRLLQSAIDAGEFAAAEEIDAEDVSEEEMPAFEAVSTLKRHFLAVDDLTHALDVRPDFPAALTLADTLMRLTLGSTASATDRAGLMMDWLSHRGVNAQLVDVVAARNGEDDLSKAVVERAQNLGVGQARALCLWTLSDQLAARRRPHNDCLKNWHALLTRGRLAALDVFDAADLWLDLDESA